MPEPPLTVASPIDAVLSRLPDARQHGERRWLARCPAHADREPSLSVTEADDRKVLINCHAGCGTDAVVSALGLEMRDLYPRENGAANRPTATTTGYRPKEPTPDELDHLRSYLEGCRRRLEAGGDLADRAVEYCARRFGLDRDQVLDLGLGVDTGSSVVDRPPFIRFAGTARLVIPFPDPAGHARGCQGRALDPNAKVRWMGPNGEGWARTAWFAVANPDPIVVTEGPADALAAVGAGYPAVAVRGAALAGSTAEELHWNLGGHQVVVAGDRDNAGAKFTATITTDLAGRGIAVAAITPPAPHDDLAAWCETAGDQFPTELGALIDQAEPVKPPDPPSSLQQVAEDERRGGHTLTDVGNAGRFVDGHASEVLHVARWRAWHIWDGRRWGSDETGDIVERAKRTARTIYTEAAFEEDPDRRKALGKWARMSENAARIRAMIDLAASDPKVAARADDLDSDPWVLNAHNGTIDLRTGRLRPHDPRDRITKLAGAAYRPDAAAPTWLAFLERIMDGNDELIAFLQRAAGYALTGSVSEQVMFFLHGKGANGKSTFLSVLMDVLGDYARQTEPDLLLARRNEPHPTGLADLAGARFAVAQEVEEGRRMAESLVKLLTGGDRIKARFMHRDFFEFTPTHKLFLAANHKPVVRGTDVAIWRRLRLIPFAVSIPLDEQDHDLVGKLHAEADGILAWAVAGCLAWQEQGLQAPDEVMAATADYRGEMDTIGDFLDELCYLDPNAMVEAKDLYAAYKEWSEAAGEKPKTQKGLGQLLTERGFDRHKGGRNNRYRWVGIGLSDCADHRGPSAGLFQSEVSHEGDNRGMVRDGPRSAGGQDRAQGDLADWEEF